MQGHVRFGANEPKPIRFDEIPIGTIGTTSDKNHVPFVLRVSEDIFLLQDSFGHIAITNILKIKKDILETGVSVYRVTPKGTSMTITT